MFGAGVPGAWELSARSAATLIIAEAGQLTVLGASAGRLGTRAPPSGDTRRLVESGQHAINPPELFERGLHVIGVVAAFHHRPQDLGAAFQPLASLVLRQLLAPPVGSGVGRGRRNRSV